MRKTIAALALAGLSAFALTASAQEAAPIPPAPISPAIARTLDQLREAALRDDFGYATVEDLVTQIGPRRAGSPEEARAREWAVAMLRAQRFTNVHIEPFTMKSWEPIDQSASIVAPIQQPMVVAALGGSPSTPPGGIEAEVVRFANLDALGAASAEAVRGRIVFIDEPMARTNDGSGYGAAVRKRARCVVVAQPKGAVACVIRSVGTNSDRFAHQGGGRQPAGTSLPAMALSPPDADILARLMAHATAPVRIRLAITSAMRDDAPSGNTIAEIRGRERPNEIVLAAAHLDSWTLGQGAIDDGAGVAIITAAARLINNLPRHPRRTIRLLIAGSEEPGGMGGDAYIAAHRTDTHIVAAESDLGADLIWRVRTGFGAGAVPFARALQLQLGPLAIIPGDNGVDNDSGGTDIEPTTKTGVPVIVLNQDASHYFDIHHTANDTINQIDRQRLRQNIAAWAITLYLAAETNWDFRATAAPAAASSAH